MEGGGDIKKEIFSAKFFSIKLTGLKYFTQGFFFHVVVSPDIFHLLYLG